MRNRAAPAAWFEACYRSRIMNAIDLLQRHHRKVEMIFKKLVSGRTEPEPLVIELANILVAHMAIEQEIFYPAVAKVDTFVVAESYEEHSLAEVALTRLIESDPEDAVVFKARVIAAREVLMHHIHEEEEQLFKKVQRSIRSPQLEQLGRAMKTHFDEVYEAGYESVIPKTFKKTSADVARRRVPALKRAA